MPGLLAGLFAGGSTPQGVTVESQHAQPASVSSPASLPEIHEQLRALNDPDVALKGLRSLRLRLQASDAQDARACLVLQISGIDALGSIWDNQSLVRNENISTALLLACASLLEQPQHDQTHQLDSLAVSQTLDQLAEGILARRAKYLQQQLASTVRHKANAVLYLLAAIAGRGGGLTAHLLKICDSDLPIFVKLAHPPKLKQTDGTASKGTSLLRAWGEKDPLKKPSCALLVTLVQAMLHHADEVSVTATVTSRPLMAAILHHLSVHPHAVVIETLGLVSSKILQAGQGLPPAMQAEAFSDSALLQLCYVSEREGGGPKAVEAATAAHNTLMALGTDASHGMLPASDTVANELHEEDEQAKHKAPLGQARLLRLLHKLKVTEVDRHAELLLGVCAASPAMAADYLSSCSLALDPKAGSSRWLVAMTLLGQVVQAAAKVTNPFTKLMRRGCKPPAMSDPVTQAFLNRSTPACLPRAVLSKGIQHSDALVRYTTLCALLKILQTVQPALLALQAELQTLACAQTHNSDLDTHAQRLSLRSQPQQNEQHSASAITPLDVLNNAADSAFAVLQQQQHQLCPFLTDDLQQHEQSPPTQWTDFSLQLQQSLRARLPDPQSLLAVLATLQKSSAQADAATTDKASKDESPLADSPQDESELLHQLPGNKSVVSDKDLNSSVPESVMTATELTSAVVLMLLAIYQRCLPEAMSDSHMDVFSLMPQEVLDLPPLQQHALLELQMTVVSPMHLPDALSHPTDTSLSDPPASQSTSGLRPTSAASFLPVLKLLTGSLSHAVCQLASQLLTIRMTDLLGGAFAPEVSLWLGLLPKRPDRSDDHGATWITCVDAVLGFLAEAVASLSRRPHYYWGLMQTLLRAHTLDHSQGGNKSKETEFSLLAVCALQQALKVACSSKLPSESRTWISAYTAAALSQLLRVQTSPQPLCHIVLGLFGEAAESALAAEAATEADAAQHAQQAARTGSNYAEHAVLLSLPAEAQTLASLLVSAQDLLCKWQNPGRTSNPRQQPLRPNPGANTEDLKSSNKKRRKGEQAQLDDGGKKSKKYKHEQLPVASSPSEPEVSMISADSASERFRILTGQLKANSRSRQSQEPEQQQLPLHLHQQLLTALYQCPASVVQQQQLPAIAELLHSQTAHDGHGMSHDSAESAADLSIAVGRAFGIGCHISSSKLPGLPFLLLLQSATNHADSDNMLHAQLKSSLQTLPAHGRPLATLALMQQLQMATDPASVQLFFSLLRQSLRLTASQGSHSQSPQREKQSWIAQAEVESVNESLDKSAIRQLLQQPWLMSHWLSGHPLGHHVAAAWDCEMAQLLHSVLSLSCKAESAATALNDACKPYLARLAAELDKALAQNTASSTPSTAHSTAGVTAAAVLQDDDSAILYAASCLACFLPLTDLLNLTRAALKCSEPQVETSEQAQRQNGVAKLGLDLAEALISAWTGQSSRDALRAYTVARVMQNEERDPGQGSGAAWVLVAKGLMERALDQESTSRHSVDAHIHELLLRLMQSSQPAFFDWCFSSCQQAVSQYLQMVLLSATCTTGMVAAEFIMLSSGLCAELRHHFEALTSGTVTGDSSLPHEAMAFLLPVAKAYLQQLSMPAVHALHAGRVQQLPQHDSPAAAASRPAALGTDDDHAASTTELDAVRACFAREMVQYMTAKVKAPQGFDQLSADASSSLHQHAVDLLRLCWTKVPAGDAERHRLLHKLLPPKGWQLPVGPESTSSGSSGPCDPAWLPLPSQHAEVTKMLLERAVQEGNLELEDLSRFTQTCLATLTAAYKQQSLTQQNLVSQLTDYVDDFIGDRLAELPDQDRSSGPLSNLAGPLSAFAAAVLKFKLDSPASVKLLRRLLAALLPDNSADAMSEASSDLASAEQGATNPQIGAVAAQIFDRLIGHSKFVPVMLDMNHSLLPLPTAVQKLKLRSPFASILPLVDIQPLSTIGLKVKGEVVELLDTLLDLQQSYPPPHPKLTPTTPAISLEQKLHSLLPLLLAGYGATLSSPDQSLLRLLLHINDIIYNSDEYQEKLQEKFSSARNNNADRQQSTGLVIPGADRVQAVGDAPGVIGYGSGLAHDSSDANAGTEIHAKDDAGQANGDTQSDEMTQGQGPITALLQGPLAEAGFLWGAAAKLAHEQGLLTPQTDPAKDASIRAKLARQNSQVDAGRCALTTIHYPEQRTLTADNATSEPLPAVLQQLAATAQALTAGSGRHFAAAEIPQSGGGHRQAAASASQPLQSLTEDLSNHQSNLSDSRNSPSTSGNVQEGKHSTMAAGVRYHAAGHDPVWLLLYTVKALQGGCMTAEETMNQGLLSLCLRSLAAKDDGLRALAYEAVGLCLAALSASRPKSTQQVQLLLASLKRSLSQPFQQLPGIIATFAAEAVYVFMAPGSAMYSPVNKLLLKQPALNIEEIPLMYQLLVSGNQQHVEERSWMLHLLAAGLRGPLDAQLYRRRFVAELLMSLHDSALADVQTRKSAMYVLAAATLLPAYGKDLINRAGLQTWMNAQSCEAAACKL